MVPPEPVYFWKADAGILTRYDVMVELVLVPTNSNMEIAKMAVAGNKANRNFLLKNITSFSS